jgi:hypothetical protein
MADFLQRVAQMALGAAPAIAPLVASRYAPDAQGVEPELLQHEVMREARVPVANRTAATTRREADTTVAPHPGRNAVAMDRGDAVAPRIVPPDATDAAVRDAAAVSALAVPHAQRRLTVEQARSHAADHGAHVARREADDTARVTAPPAPYDVVEQVAALSATNENGPRLALHPDSRRPPVAIEPHEADAARRDRPDLAERDPTRPGAPEPAQPVPDAGEDRRARAPAARPAPEWRAPPPPTAASSLARAPATLPHEAEVPHPSVRVTIGRVEVRAVAPPVPPLEVPVAPAPRLSLDEYLRQYGGRPR